MDAWKEIIKTFFPWSGRVWEAGGWQGAEQAAGTPDLPAVGKGGCHSWAVFADSASCDTGGVLLSQAPPAASGFGFLEPKATLVCRVPAARPRGTAPGSCSPAAPCSSMETEPLQGS